MRVLILNPNSSSEISYVIEREAKKYEKNDLEIDVIHNETAPSEIVTAYDELTSGYDAVRLLKDKINIYDGAIIGCFADPGLYAAKYICNKPVTGFLESSLTYAKLIGFRYSLIASGDQKDISLFKKDLFSRGDINNLASIRYINSTVLDAVNVNPLLLEELSKKCKYEDGANVIILACAAFAGKSDSLSKKIGLPVIDGVKESILLLESLIKYEEIKKIWNKQ